MKASARPSGKSGRRFNMLLLLVAIVLAVIVWQVSLRRPAGPASGQSLSETASNQMDRQTLRVGTFNIHSAKGVAGKIDLDRIAQKLEGLDLVGLNEVRGSLPWRQVNQAQLLGEKLEMPFLFAPSEKRWGMDYFGNGLLCSLPVTNWLRIPLPGVAKKRLRNMLLVSVDFGGRDVHVLITHIDNMTDREKQLRLAIALFLALEEPAILMGDLNTPSNDEQLQTLLATEEIHDAAAGIVQPNGRGRIDWIITRGLQTVRAEVRESDASDHPLVSAELRLTK